jgi:hypothetical protein
LSNGSAAAAGDALGSGRAFVFFGSAGGWANAAETSTDVKSTRTIVRLINL